MRITKEQVLEALIVIENYKNQSLFDVNRIEKESDKRSIMCLGLQAREHNCLKAANIDTIGELLAIDRYEIRKFRNLGKKAVMLINEALKAKGIETEDFVNW